MRWAYRLLLLASLSLTASACKQGAGDRCQVQSDCDDNLLCVLPAGGTPQSGGTCQPTNGTADMTVTPEADMTALPDMTVVGTD